MRKSTVAVLLSVCILVGTLFGVSPPALGQVAATDLSEVTSVETSAAIRLPSTLLQWVAAGLAAGAGWYAGQAAAEAFFGASAQSSYLTDSEVNQLLSEYAAQPVA